MGTVTRAEARRTKAAGGGSAARFIAPMKALGSDVVPSGTWHCEIKFDGYRAIGIINAGKAAVWSRNRNEMSRVNQGITGELGRLPCANAVVDGEIVALDQAGHSRFQLLQNGGEDAAGLAYYVFDILHLDGRLLTGEPLEERSRILARLLRKSGPLVRASPVFKVEPSALFEQARRNGLEGIIAKRPGSPYEPGRRSGAWLKCKVLAEQEFVIGGFTAPQRSRRHFGAILVGYYEGRALRYAGKVGTGFDGKLLGSLHARFMAKESPKCPFSDLPSERRSRFGKGMGAAEMERVTWVRPSLVAQVKFAEWTSDGLLRQPVFLGLRKDKAASGVRREKAAIR
jgi:bifunctional non-homologous end joining protein LigD